MKKKEIDDRKKEYFIKDDFPRSQSVDAGEKKDEGNSVKSANEQRDG